jgi:NAD+ synthase (glutamine-hydrolysing)
MVALTVVMAQIDTLVGDIDGNTQRVIDNTIAARRQFAADVVVFPELTLCGYPPEDLLLRPSVQIRVEKALKHLCSEKALADVYVVFGYPQSSHGQLLNMAGVLYQGRIIAEYAKQFLPNYQVFDEKRYFSPGNCACVVAMKGVPVALTVCEDIWEAEPMTQAVQAGAKLLLNLSASPFHRNKQLERQHLIAARSRESLIPLIYTNLVGGQDELVFDGGSMAVNTDGDLCVQAPGFVEGLYPVYCEYSDHHCRILPGDIAPETSELSSIYQALVLGVRDYVNKNRFKGVVLGLSGGIDSALTLVVAVDALGAERVSAVMMPFRYTSEMSRDDAAEQANMLGVKYSSISIEPMFEAFMSALSDEFAGSPRDTTEENMQARCRGVLLMAISNKKGSLVLTTGNKSEMAVGYSTLYGDMAGGLDVLKDVPKTLVYALSEYRNSLSPAIPRRVIDRPPSAELAPDQKDEDSLPPYSELDRILELYVERDYSADAIVAEGFDEATVHRVIGLVDINEYKRRQAPVGIRITQRGFGRDRRYPITSGWKPGA